MSIYFIVPKGTDTFNKLLELFERVEAANAEADRLVKELGGTRSYTDAWHYLSGGLKGIEMPEKPENWRLAIGSKAWQKIYFPKSCPATKEVREKIQALPEIRTRELLDILNWRKILSRPGVKKVDASFIVAIPTGGIEANKYEPSPDLVEISGSRYIDLYESVRKEDVVS